MRSLAILGVMALTACGSGEESTTIAGTTYTSDESGTATISNERGSISALEGEAAANTAMPDFAPQYPGSTIENALVSQREGVERTMVVFATNDDVGKVAEFYREKFAAAGLEIKSEMMVDEGGMISAEGDGKRASISISQEEGRNMGTVSFSGA